MPKRKRNPRKPKGPPIPVVRDESVSAHGPKESDEALATGPGPRSLAAIFALTLVVRVVYFLTADGPSFRDPLIDADYYDFLGTQLASGGGFEPGPFWQPPLYPMVLGGLYAALGHDLLWPRLFQALCDALTSVLVVRIAFGVIGRRAWALAAGVVVALHGSLVFYSGEILPTSLAVLASTVAISFASNPKGPMWRAAACGAAIGLGALSVATTLVLVAPLAWLWGRVERRRGWAVLGAALVTVLPVTATNHLRSGEWIPISANGGINLYIGNSDRSEQLVAVRPGAAWESLVNEPTGMGITTPAGQDGYFVRKALGWCAGTPHRCLAGLLWKARLLLRSKDIPRNESLEVVKTQSPISRLLLARAGGAALPYVLLLPLAAAGLTVAYRRRRHASTLVAWATVALSSMPVLFFVTGRYRTALAPCLAVLAVLGARTIWVHRREAWREAIAALCVLSLAVWPAPQPVDDVHYEAEMHYAVGGRRARLADDPGAIASWRRAVAMRPDYMEAHFNLALAYMRGERWAEAADAFRGVLRLDPAHVQARSLLQACEEHSPAR